MRYIGSKLKLIGYIEEVILKYCGNDLSDKVFCDLFAGTGVVGRSFAPYVKKVIANDMEYYSSIANIVALKGYNVDLVKKYLIELNQIEPDYDCKFAQYYAEGGSAGRLFYSKENGAKIGAARNYIDSLNIDELTRHALILSVINGSDEVANSTGVYGAYLKSLKDAARKPVVFKLPEMAEFAENFIDNEIYKDDANELINDIHGDILYLDPPYNTRQYSSNYHILNYIAYNEYPETDSVAGLGEHNKSKYSSKKDAASEFEELIKNADFEWIFLSYNNEGIIPIDKIKDIFSKYGDYFVEEKEHQRYKADSKRRNLAGTDKTIEYIHVLHKKNIAEDRQIKIPSYEYKDCALPLIPSDVNGSEEKYIVSPMNYMGGKKKLLNTLLYYFPDNTNTFVDLFCGGATVGINAKAKQIIFNDNIEQLIGLYNAFAQNSLEDIISHIENRINEYGLSETNEEGYYNFREFYNQNQNPLDVFVLAAYSFNNQIRFNSKGEFNIPFGKNRSSFNSKMRQNLKGFVEAIHKKNVKFINKDFENFDFDSLTENDFVYCDPPYLVSVATYNSGWDENKENALLDKLSELNDRGIKFALSNVLENKGEENTILKEWTEKNNFNVIHLDKTYANCYYQRKDKENKSDEVLIINYNLPMEENNLNLFTKTEEMPSNEDIIQLNKIYNCDCYEGLKKMEDNSVDLTVTSPPYDNLRKYTDKNSGDCEWNYDVFTPIADELYRVTKKGGVLVWVVGDATINGEETGSSFRQALYFQSIGFKLHDTMIYEKNSSSFPAKLSSKRYTQIFEYMFVFSKGKIRDDIKLIADKRNKWAGWTNWGQHSQYNANGNLIKTDNIKPIAEFSLRTNIWRYPVSFNDKTNHPAVFPEKLAEDHILSWSNEGDTVLDPFMGSGTTAKMAMLNHRNYIGFERNTEYYEESLKRVEKHVGKENVLAYEINENDETMIVNPSVDKDDDKKILLWKEATKELEDYFNTQSYGILKNLKVNLSFVSKSNDKRVEKVIGEAETSPQEKPVENKVIKDNFPEDNEDNLFSDYDFENFPVDDDNSPDIDKIITDKVCEITDRYLKDKFEEMYSNFCNSIVYPETKHRGRPKGSRNKKVENAPETNE